MHLFHFSDNPDIEIFEPRPLRIAVDRDLDRAWLNGPLVWATDPSHSLLYLFPRECPRIVIWPTPVTSKRDRDEWFGTGASRAIAFVEDAWRERMRNGRMHRYEMPQASFETIDDVGMWVSRTAVVPTGLRTVADLPGELEAHNVELRFVPRLTPFKHVWQTTLHASGIRLRNAQEW